MPRAPRDPRDLRDRALPRRLRLVGVERAQWDAAHPGPIAPRIAPTHADDEGRRYELHTRRSATCYDAWVRLPSPSQRAAHCARCPGRRHDPTHAACAAAAAETAHAYPRAGIVLRGLCAADTPVADAAAADLPGRWLLVHLVVLPRYMSGSVTLELVR